LRERVEDIPLLTKFFVAKFAACFNKRIDLIPDEVMAVLKAHDWPGNIRELQNFIEHAVLFSPGSVLPVPLGLKQTVKQSPESASRQFAHADQEDSLETLMQTDWLIGGQGGAANQLGLPRTPLIYKMRKLGVETRRALRALGDHLSDNEGDHAEKRKRVGHEAGPDHEQLCWRASGRETRMVPTLHTVSSVGCPVFSWCVVTNPACERFGHHYRSEWRRCPRRQRYNCQLGHWIETERPY
jgi:hypothetical protein